MYATNLPAVKILCPGSNCNKNIDLMFVLGPET